MIDSLQLKNFKAFKEDLNIELSSKNFLLYGENGAGKSSIFEAIKIIFFKNRLEEEIPSAPTPEEQEQITSDYWSNYNNKITNNDFEIISNGTNYNDFSSENYQLFMISLENIKVEDKMNLDTMLRRFFLDIIEIDNFCLTNYKEIQEKVNSAIVSFNDSFKIEIDNEDNFSIKIIDRNKNIESKTEIRKFFNEARLNLVILLIVLTSIRIAKDESKNKIIVLDDFITSLDASNRTFLIKYIIEKFSDFQVLMFTHNVGFYNLTMYIINSVFDENHKWKFANLYEIGNLSKIYIKGVIEKTSDIKALYESASLANNIENVGNKIRQKFEILLYEFSKLLMVGAVEDSKKIIERIENGKNIYCKNRKTASDLIDEIQDLLHFSQNKKLRIKKRLQLLIKEYKHSEFHNLKSIIKELKLYQKVTLHPMSHGTIGQSTFTTKEIEKSLQLLQKFEKQIEKLTNTSVEVI